MTVSFHLINYLFPSFRKLLKVKIDNTHFPETKKINSEYYL